MVKVRAFRTLENSIRRMGFNCVAGVDEVGRGCHAGPVVAAAVVLNPDRYIPRVCDSKTVTAIERAELYERITRCAIAWKVAAADCAEIDRINIHQASLMAMRRAVLEGRERPVCLGEPPAFVAMLAEALALDARGEGEAAAALRRHALAAAEPVEGTLNGAPFACTPLRGSNGCAGCAGCPAAIRRASSPSCSVSSTDDSGP